MKHEWKKQEKEIYMPKNNPEVVTVPEYKYFMIDGRGNPNNEEFAETIGVLYALSYAVKMMPKKGFTPEGYFDYTVYPLEGVWDLAEEARGLEKLDKDSLIYTAMIRQPDFVTEELALDVIKSVKHNKPHRLLENVRFGTLEDGLCIQMMHIGPYDEEKVSFAMMQDYCEKMNMKRTSMIHREIYISDTRKTAPEKLKTVLRFKAEASS
jgi:hypothetical protein